MFEIERMIEELKEQLANGATLGNETLTAYTVGQIHGLRELLNVDIEEGEDD